MNHEWSVSFFFSFLSRVSHCESSSDFGSPGSALNIRDSRFARALVAETRK